MQDLPRKPRKESEQTSARRSKQHTERTDRLTPLLLQEPSLEPYPFNFAQVVRKKISLLFESKGKSPLVPVLPLPNSETKRQELMKTNIETWKVDQKRTTDVKETSEDSQSGEEHHVEEKVNENVKSVGREEKGLKERESPAEFKYESDFEDTEISMGPLSDTEMDIHEFDDTIGSSAKESIPEFHPVKECTSDSSAAGSTKQKNIVELTDEPHSISTKSDLCSTLSSIKTDKVRAQSTLLSLQMGRLDSTNLIPPSVSLFRRKDNMEKTIVSESEPDSISTVSVTSTKTDEKKDKFETLKLPTDLKLSPRRTIRRTSRAGSGTDSNPRSPVKIQETVPSSKSSSKSESSRKENTKHFKHMTSESRSSSERSTIQEEVGSSDTQKSKNYSGEYENSSSGEVKKYNSRSSMEESENSVPIPASSSAQLGETGDKRTDIEESNDGETPLDTPQSQIPESEQQAVPYLVSLFY